MFSKFAIKDAMFIIKVKNLNDICKKQDIFFRILRLRAFQIKGMVDAKSMIACFVLLYFLFMGFYIKHLKQQSPVILEENYFINCFAARKTPFLLRKYLVHILLLCL